VAQCICGEPNRKEAFNIGHGKTFAIVYNIDVMKIENFNHHLPSGTMHMWRA